ncbi:hypothetical protein FPV67DRAFT_1502304 [Lyophyllum atratum]|nr:hypothetical protein FPV67DRAFT_1502304 [Lyophyllum atratum]
MDSEAAYTLLPARMRCTPPWVCVRAGCASLITPSPAIQCNRPGSENIRKFRFMWSLLVWHTGVVARLAEEARVVSCRIVLSRLFPGRVHKSRRLCATLSAIHPSYRPSDWIDGLEMNAQGRCLRVGVLLSSMDHGVTVLGFRVDSRAPPASGSLLPGSALTCINASVILDDPTLCCP